MRIIVRIVVWGSVFLCFAGASAFAQQKPAANDASLGEIARQLKAQKAKGPKPVMVITNDNLPGFRDESSGVSPSSLAKSAAESAPENAAAQPAAHDEQYYRAQMSKLQDQLDTDNRQLGVLQQKLGLNQTQYYPDPNKTLHQEYSREDINKLNADIDAAKQKVADDEKAIDELHEQLRREGGDPGWLR